MNSAGNQRQIREPRSHAYSLAGLNRFPRSARNLLRVSLYIRPRQQSDCRLASEPPLIHSAVGSLPEVFDRRRESPGTKKYRDVNASLDSQWKGNEVYFRTRLLKSF